MSGNPNILQQLAAGYSGDGQERHQRKLAEMFKPNEQLESLLALQQQDPTAFNALPSITKIGLGFYQSAKLAYESERRNDEHAN